MEDKGGVKRIGRVEIDTRRPFRSVKDAVMLFGETVLVGEIYAHKLNQIYSEKDDGDGEPKLESITAKLEEARESLVRVVEEKNSIARCLESLKEELEETRKEIWKLKVSTKLLSSHQNNTTPLEHDSEIEDLKFVESASQKESEFQNKKCVSFADPHTSKECLNNRIEKLKKKKTKKPLFGRFFPHKHMSYCAD